MNTIFSSLMAAVYSAISAVLLSWHAARDKMLGDASGLDMSWSWVLGIVFLVLTVRAALFPIMVKQAKSQRAVQVPRVPVDPWGAVRALEVLGAARDRAVSGRSIDLKCAG